jgi:hypothetical protein
MSNLDEKVAIHHDEEQAGNLDALKKIMTVDTLHNDEAVKIIAQFAGDHEWTEQEEKKLRRKIDRKLLPILCITYGLQYYDKAMLGQAVSRWTSLWLIITDHIVGSVRSAKRSRT